MKDNKITVRFNDEELESIRKIAKKKDIKVATLIRNTMLSAIDNNELLSEKQELQQFIIDTVEKANDKKIGRIISLIFRATSHIDVVREQNNIFYHCLKITEANNYEHYSKYSDLIHPITYLSEEKIEKRDIQNINRKKGMNDFDE